MDKADRLAQLKKRYHFSLSGKAMELEEKWHAVSASEFASPALAELTLYVHQLVGSTGMYGYHQPAQIARDLEAYLKAPAAAEDAWREKIAACVHALVRALVDSQQATGPYTKNREQ